MPTTMNRISKIKKIILWSVIIGGIISLFIPALVHGAPKPADVCNASAGNNCLTGTTSLSGGVGSESIVKTIITFARLLTFVAAGIAILFIVIGGIRMIVSNGNESQYKDSLKTVQYAIIGLVITAIAYSLVSIVSGIVTTVDLSPK